MQKPEVSKHFKSRQPSSIRMAQIEFLKRDDKVEAVNTAIGNVTLPMHPAMIQRMHNLCSGKESYFRSGVVGYTPSSGTVETMDAFRNIIASSGLKSDNLSVMVTDGGSQAMEIALVGVCGEAGTGKKPLLMIDAAYTNYIAFAERIGRKTVSVTRKLLDNGKFTLPDLPDLERVIQEYQPGALVVIPYDNPTGHFCNMDSMIELAKLCVKYNMWMISDEAYRELLYINEAKSSIWALNDSLVQGIEGRRISIETASKVWNACGLRIGALVTDNKEFYDKALAEYTTNLCANAIGQYIFGAIAHESHEDLNKWYQQLRDYYKPLFSEVRKVLIELLPGVIVSSPEASLYSVVDVRNIAKKGFNSTEFSLYCAQKGNVEIEGKHYTLLIAPMSGFYDVKKGEENPGMTQLRIAYVPKPEKIMIVPYLFDKLFKEFESKR
ncbi:MAG TPA: aminotransferase class I/II [Lentisphaeria bacterium]|nr:MAG: aminotransferase class I/II [Lentisphaerae bacterium GWF2_38_69]HBM15836.1 aminotransferase class I/II [Lentisphaeria bacterium]